MRRTLRTRSPAAAHWSGNRFSSSAGAPGRAGARTESSARKQALKGRRGAKQLPQEAQQIIAEVDLGGLGRRGMTTSGEAFITGYTNQLRESFTSTAGFCSLLFRSFPRLLSLAALCAYLFLFTSVPSVYRTRSKNARLHYQGSPALPSPLRFGCSRHYDRPCSSSECCGPLLSLGAIKSGAETLADCLLASQQAQASSDVASSSTSAISSAATPAAACTGPSIIVAPVISPSLLNDLTVKDVLNDLIREFRR